MITKKPFPFFVGYVFVPKVLFRFTTSSTSPETPVSTFVLSFSSSPLTWKIQCCNISKHYNCKRVKVYNNLLTPPYCSRAEKLLSLVIEVSCSSPIPKSPVAIGGDTEGPFTRCITWKEHNKQVLKRSQIIIIVWFTG